MSKYSSLLSQKGNPQSVINILNENNLDYRIYVTLMGIQSCDSKNESSYYNNFYIPSKLLLNCIENASNLPDSLKVKMKYAIISEYQSLLGYVQFNSKEEIEELNQATLKYISDIKYRKEYSSKFNQSFFELSKARVYFSNYKLNEKNSDINLTLQSIRTAIVLKPDEWKPYNFRANVMMDKLKDTVSAIKDYKKVQEILSGINTKNKDEYYRSWFNVACEIIIGYYSLGKYNEAILWCDKSIKEFERIQEIRNKNPRKFSTYIIQESEEKIAEIYYHKAFSLSNLGRYNESCNSLRISREFGFNVEAISNLITEYCK